MQGSGSSSSNTPSQGLSPVGALGIGSSDQSLRRSSVESQWLTLVRVVVVNGGAYALVVRKEAPWQLFGAVALVTLVPAVAGMIVNRIIGRNGT